MTEEYEVTIRTKYKDNKQYAITNDVVVKIVMG